VRIYDISVGISPELPIWPGDPPVVIERIKEIVKGEDANVSRLECGVHIGTHVDAPIHFIDGSSSVETMPLRALIGRAYVVHLPNATVIDETTLEKSEIPPRTRRILFRTSNSNYWARGERKFKKDFVAIDASGATWLVRKKVQLVGIDYLSIAPFEASRETHRILLENGVVVVEGLDLSEVSQGRYKIYCLPLKIIGSDGAPARTILLGV
jgi:arylformamidase